MIVKPELFADRVYIKDGKYYEIRSGLIPLRCSTCGNLIEYGSTICEKCNHNTLCPICKENKAEVETWDGEWICEDCVYRYCDDCDKAIDHEGDAIYIERYDKVVCPNCFESYVQCDNCGNYLCEEDCVKTYDDHRICDYCRDEYTFECYMCRKLFYIQVTNKDETWDGELICESCASKCRTCSNCGLAVPEDDAVHLESGVELCPRCAEERENKRWSI